MPRLLNWTRAEIDLIVAQYPTTRTEDLVAQLPGRSINQVHAKANGMGLRKNKEVIRAMQRAQMARPDHPARQSLFAPGLTPWNKGKSYHAGGRSAETQFKRGSRSHTWKPIGTERISSDGYLQRKLTDTGYPPRDWVCVHHIIWREAGRDIPQGHRLIFKDGNARNVTLDNLMLISMADLMQRNSVHKYGPEFSKANQLRGAITRQLNQLKRTTNV